MISSESFVGVWPCIRVSKLLLLVSATIAVFVVCVPLFSQTNQGRISGAVFDQTGGAIPGATVTVTDVARGVTQTLTTDGAGQYSASSLVPSTYTVRGQAKGFKTTEHTGVLVQVGEDIRVDLTLQAGEQAQTITVTAEIPLVETTSASLGGALSNQTINELPLNGRNFENLITLRPGVMVYPGGGNSSQSTNGLRVESGLYLLDGLLNSDAGSGNSVMNVQFQIGDSTSSLPIDAIQEFSTQVNPKAEYGWAPGAIVNVGLKSGTNAIHGSAYAFGRSDAFDARNFFNPATYANGTPNPKTPLNFEQFGATAGGPVVKNKLFWFVGYEQQRYTVGDIFVGSAPASVSLATPSNPAGNPAASIVDACAALVKAGKVISPLSAQLAGLNPTTCVLSPASSTVENIFPVNNGTNPQGPAVFAPELPNNNVEQNGVAKVDYHMSDHNSLNGSYFIGDLNGTWVTGPDQLESRWQNPVTSRVFALTGDWTWTPNSSWVNEYRAGYDQIRSVNLSSDGTVNPAAPWPTGYGINTGVTNPQFFGFPYLQISGLNNFALGHGNHTYVHGPSGEFDTVDDVSYLRGKHSIKFGGEFVYNVLDGDSFNNSQGQIKFGSLNNYLLGIPANGKILVGDNNTHFRNDNFAGFIQDDYRVVTRVTLNLGLRYEFVLPAWETDHLQGNFLPNVGLVQNGNQISQEVNNDYRNFSPRLGLAWDINGNGKTVLRAAFNIMYPTEVFAGETEGGTVPFGADIVVNGVTTPGSQAAGAQISYTAAQLQPGWNLTGPVFPVATNNRLVCGDGITPAGSKTKDPGPCTTAGVAQNLRTPYVTAWNLDIQRAVTNNLTVDIAYVGNHSAELPASVDINQPPIGAGWFGPHGAAAACLASAPSYSNCAPSTADETAAEPFHSQFPYLQFINQVQNLDKGSYDGLQVTVTQRAYHGLSFLAGYTYSHSLDDVSTIAASNPFRPQDVYDPALEYGSSDYDIRHRFTLSLTYALPGKKSPGQLLEGWSINSIVTLQSGLPWGVMDNNDDFTGTGEFKNTAPTRWDFTGTPFASGPNAIPCYGPLSNCNPTIPQACMTAAQANGPLAVASLVNLGCYMENGGILTPAAYGSLGTMGRNIFRDSGFRNWDFSLLKDWKFTERFAAQFRAEFFNILNHPNFANPYGARAGYDNNDPSGGSGFGCGCITPDAAATNFVVGAGGARDIQLGLKLTF
jgi:Carboxypeptidase regulatory-like domain/TonB dependent receptor-like, beta-barrel